MEKRRLGNLTEYGSCVKVALKCFLVRFNDIDDRDMIWFIDIEERSETHYVSEIVKVMLVSMIDII